MTVGRPAESPSHFPGGRARVLIACGIYQDELEHVLASIEAPELKIIWLEAGLDNNLEMLEAKLAEAISETRAAGGSDLRLLFGRACLPHMAEFAQRQGVTTLAAKNCIAAMIGDERKLELEKDRTMVVTPAWVRKMWLDPGGVKSILGWTETDFRINLGRYDRILVLDTGLHPLTDEEILEAFDLIEVPLEFEPCDLGLFRDNCLNFLA